MKKPKVDKCKVNKVVVGRYYTECPKCLKLHIEVK